MICPNCKSNNIAVSNIQTSYTTYQTVAVCQNCGTSGVIGQGVINQSTQSQGVQNYQTPYQVDYSKNTNTSILKRNISGRETAAIIVLILLVFFIGVAYLGVNYGGSNVQNEVTIQEEVNGIDFNGQTITVPYGELLSVIQTEDVVVVKVKIGSMWNNELTIKQNYHNIEALVDKYDFDKYSRIQYWAVADMKSGDESKVIQFDVPQWVSEAIKEDSLVATQLGDYVEELWILPSLRE